VETVSEVERCILCRDEEPIAGRYVCTTCSVRVGLERKADAEGEPYRDGDHQVDREARADALERDEALEREYAEGRERPELAVARRLR
jgi:hypothetical protein